jgi:hypothetical protein
MFPKLKNDPRLEDISGSDSSNTKYRDQTSPKSGIGLLMGVCFEGDKLN